MKKLRKNIFYTIFFLLLAGCFLFHAEKTAEFAYIGLNTWFEQMIVSLFPFMVLMNLLLRTGLSNYFIRPFYYILRPIFRNNADAIFVVFFGFLCGFPLGGKCVVDLYEKGNLSKKNAEYLLCFVNNIGPAYMVGFFLNTIKPPHPSVLALLFLYGIPVLYGLILRYTVYKLPLDAEQLNLIRSKKTHKSQAILYALPDAIKDALLQIAILGGYMIIFNALRIVPHVFFESNPSLYIATQSLLEISGGLLCVNTSLPDGLIKTLCLYAVFSFQGICCHFQTFSLLQRVQLSGQKYMLHKIILCSITVLFVWLYEATK